jgi:hypothetical protein
MSRPEETCFGYVKHLPGAERELVGAPGGLPFQKRPDKILIHTRRGRRDDQDALRRPGRPTLLRIGFGAILRGPWSDRGSWRPRLGASRC